jgi:hypothetical protein
MGAAAKQSGKLTLVCGHSVPERFAAGERWMGREGLAHPLSEPIHGLDEEAQDNSGIHGFRHKGYVQQPDGG